MTALVAARGLERIYEIGGGVFRQGLDLRAVNGVSFDVDAGRTLAVVGESGCGKSTLARMITMIDAPTAGTLTIDGLDAINPAHARDLRRRVQIVFQNPYGSLNPRKTVQAILEEPLLINTKLSTKERRARVADMLKKVGLRPEHARRYPHMFSGGQRQRIAIARALMLNPKLLVADEPVSALDVSVQAQILNLLADLQRDLGIAYIFISHDLGVVRHIAHDVLVMYLGLAVEQGPKEKIFGNALHPYTQALLASTPGLGRRREAALAKGELPSPLNPPTGCVFSTRCSYVTDTCRAERPPLRSVDGRDVACHYAEEFIGGRVPVR
ncbi:MAG TPA: dipeptide ABC transporter ATP-binding protein [Pseudorhodoplanes sp.]|nr:dipeptide ABC transporter ATP-binding protein [Pseudorhodoplanes sp.]